MYILPPLQPSKNHVENEHINISIRTSLKRSFLPLPSPSHSTVHGRTHKCTEPCTTTHRPLLNDPPSGRSNTALFAALCSVPGIYRRGSRVTGIPITTTSGSWALRLTYNVGYKRGHGLSRLFFFFFFKHPLGCSLGRKS